MKNIKKFSAFILLATITSACGVVGAGTEPTTTTIEPKTSISVTEHKDGVIAYFVADVRLVPGTEIGTIVAKGKTSNVAKQNGAWFAINGDYFLHRDNGIIMRNGELIINEPKRDGMALTKDGQMVVYKEDEIHPQFLENIHAVHAFSFGPVLVNNGVIPEEVGDYYEVDEGRSINGKHPRTGMCMVEQNHFIFIVVDGRSPGYSNGVTLRKFAELFLSHGCQIAYNFDGGGSSVMYMDGELVNLPLGTGKERDNGDFLFIHKDF